MNHVTVINSKRLNEDLLLIKKYYFMFTFFQYFVSRAYTMICIKSQTLKRLTYADLTIVPFKHSSESPPGTLRPLLVEHLRNFYICKWPGPVLEKASKTLRNILENEELIFFFIQLPWGCSRLVRHSQSIFSKHPCVV